MSFWLKQQNISSEKDVKKPNYVISLEEANNQKRLLEQEVDTLNKRYSEISTEIEEWKELLNSIDDARKTISFANKQKELLSNDLDKISLEIETKQKELLALNDLFKINNEKLTETKNEVSLIKNTWEELVKQNNSLLLLNKSLTDDNKKLSDKLSKVTNNINVNEEELERLNNLSNEFDKNILLLKDNLNNLKDDNNKLNRLNTDLVSENKLLEESILKSKWLNSLMLSQNNSTAEELVSIELKLSKQKIELESVNNLVKLSVESLKNNAKKEELILEEIRKNNETILLLKSEIEKQNKTKEDFEVRLQNLIEREWFVSEEESRLKNREDLLRYNKIELENFYWKKLKNIIV